MLLKHHWRWISFTQDFNAENNCLCVSMKSTCKDLWRYLKSTEGKCQLCFKYKLVQWFILNSVKIARISKVKWRVSREQQWTFVCMISSHYYMHLVFVSFSPVFFPFQWQQSPAVTVLREYKIILESLSSISVCISHNIAYFLFGTSLLIIKKEQSTDLESDLKGHGWMIWSNYCTLVERWTEELQCFWKALLPHSSSIGQGWYFPQA